jgi:hypothetical protein
MGMTTFEAISSLRLSLSKPVEQPWEQENEEKTRKSHAASPRVLILIKHEK